MVDTYRRDHADLALSGRAKAIRCLIDIVEDPKADAKDRVKAAGVLLGQTGGPVVQVGVGVQVGADQDKATAVELVMSRLDALAALNEREQPAAEQPEVFGDVAPGASWLAELTAAEPPVAEPVIVDGTVGDARGAQSRSDGSRVGSPHPEGDRGALGQLATAAAAWTGNGFGPVGDGIGSSVDALGGPDPTSIDTAAIPLGDPAPVDTVADALVTGTERSARVHTGRLGHLITEVGKDTGSGLPSRSRRAGRTG